MQSHDSGGFREGLHESLWSEGALYKTLLVLRSCCMLQTGWVVSKQVLAQTGLPRG